MSKSRQLAAIMFTDIVGYTALMGQDEQMAISLLNKNRKLHKSRIEAYRGRWIKELGDGVMASFNTVSDAVNAAVKIQEACNTANDFQLRIGIHQGEVLFENNDVFGDTVNIAARIQAAAKPGCIFISESVQGNIANNNDFKSHFVKEETLKNVHKPVRMYQVMFEGSETIVVEDPMIPNTENSIAVLPFANMSNDPEQEYFSDGITEEIINVLAQVPGLKVIGRTSSFAFKGKNMDLKVIGEQLSVTHILEGSVRRSGTKLRITAQLIKVSDGFHLYSEKFDRELEDIFAIQDEISLAILDAVKIKLFGSVKDTVLKKYTDNVEAYQLYLKGLFYYNKYTPDAFTKAIEYFKQAIEIDPDYAIAYSGLCYSYMTMSFFNWIPADKGMPQAIKASQQCIELDDKIAESHISLGRIKLHYEWNIRAAIIEQKKAIAINPNNPEAYIQLGMCSVLLGNKEEAIAYANKAISLDPFSTMNLWMASIMPLVANEANSLLVITKQLIDLNPEFFGGYLFAGEAYLQLGDFEKALQNLKLAVSKDCNSYTLSDLGVLYGFMGDKTKAREVIKEIKKIEGIELTGNNYLANVYIAIGEWDTAFKYYDIAIQNREQHMIWKGHRFDSVPNLMEDPRAIAMFEKMNVIY
jgi:TolB-like protein/class 3 adenylate cyclase/Flp pilus assembly protein TadD